MTYLEKIEAIATESAPKIIAEADAENITTTKEVHDIIVSLLVNKGEEIKADVRSKANELLYEIDRYNADKILKCLEPNIDQLAALGVDYGALSCLVCDREESGMDLEEAIYKGIVDGWGGAYAELANCTWRDNIKRESLSNR